jgi:hypothetical protein
VAKQFKFLGKKSVNWKFVRNGVWVLRLWSGKQDPQIAMLQLSAEAYNAVRKDLHKFLTEAKIFGDVKLQPKSGPGVSMMPKKTNSPVLLVIHHGRPSRSLWVSFSIDPAPDNPSFKFISRGAILP